MRRAGYAMFPRALASYWRGAVRDGRLRPAEFSILHALGCMAFDGTSDDAEEFGLPPAGTLCHPVTLVALTSEELASQLCIQPDTFRKRRRRLIHSGFLRETAAGLIVCGHDRELRRTRDRRFRSDQSKYDVQSSTTSRTTGKGNTPSLHDASVCGTNAEHLSENLPANSPYAGSGAARTPGPFNMKCTEVRPGNRAANLEPEVDDSLAACREDELPPDAEIDLAFPPPEGGSW